jgi:hypothetical protein
MGIRGIKKSMKFLKLVDQQFVELISILRNGTKTSIMGIPMRNDFVIINFVKGIPTYLALVGGR